MKTLLIVFAVTTALLGPKVLAQDSDTEPLKPALLVIDVQNNWLPGMDQTEQANALRMINGAIWQFRQHDLPIIRVYHTDPQWGPAQDSEEFQFPESVIVQEEDPMVVKSYPCAFVKTNLRELLEEREINTLFLCGLSATQCVLATYFGAQERDYNVFMLEGAVMSSQAAQTQAVERIVDSIGWSGLELILKAATQP